MTPYFTHTHIYIKYISVIQHTCSRSQMFAMRWEESLFCWLFSLEQLKQVVNYVGGCDLKWFKCSCFSFGAAGWFHWWKEEPLMGDLLCWLSARCCVTARAPGRDVDDAEMLCRRARGAASLWTSWTAASILSVCSVFEKVLLIVLLW